MTFIALDRTSFRKPFFTAFIDKRDGLFFGEVPIPYNSKELMATLATGVSVVFIQCPDVFQVVAHLSCDAWLMQFAWDGLELLRLSRHKNKFIIHSTMHDETFGFDRFFTS